VQQKRAPRPSNNKKRPSPSRAKQQARIRKTADGATSGPTRRLMSHPQTAPVNPALTSADSDCPRSRAAAKWQG
jgi:hypothetical protein